MSEPAPKKPRTCTAPRKIFLGASDLEVSTVCLGTMTFGRMSTDQVAHDILDRYVALGGDFVDTAEMYPVPVAPEFAGKSEEIIGSWLAARPGMREKLVIATKVASAASGPGDDAACPMSREKTLGGDVAAAKNQRCDLSREQIFRACDASLRRLGIDQIDLYQVHWPERYVPKFGGSQYFFDREAEPANDPSNLVGFDALVRTMGDLIAAGKIREWGVSNETSFGVCSLVEACTRLGVKRPATIQNDFGLLYRAFEGDLAETCSRRHHNVSLLAYGVLNGGALSGKYLENGDALPTSRFNFAPKFQPRYRAERSALATQEYCALAKKHGMDGATLAQAWAYSRPYMGSVIIGATSLEQLEANWKAAMVTLPDECLKAIDEIHLRRRNPNLHD